jgi:AcrR family transcriptional regulator
VAKRAEYLGPERRRPLVLDAALKIFADGGFADASMQAIAEQAGVSKAVLYDCFPGGKSEIYLAMHERGEQRFMDHMLGVFSEIAGAPLDQALRRGILAFLEYAEVQPDSFRVIFGEAGTADPEVARRSERTRERIVEMMAERNRAFMRSAGIPVTQVSSVYPRSIVAVAESLARWTQRDSSLPREAVVDSVVNWFMKGFERIIPEGALRLTER